MKYASMFLLAITVMLLPITLPSCSNEMSTKRAKKCKLTCYREHSSAWTSSNSDDANAWIYWYILFNDQSNTYYYCSSPTQVTSFFTTAWATSRVNPVQKELDEKEIEELPEKEIDISDLPQNVQEEAETVAVQEGEPEEEVQATEPESTSESNESESSESESSGDSGSGDSGGGGVDGD